MMSRALFIVIGHAGVLFLLFACSVRP